MVGGLRGVRGAGEASVRVRGLRAVSAGAGAVLGDVMIVDVWEGLNRRSGDGMHAGIIQRRRVLSGAGLGG